MEQALKMTSNDQNYYYCYRRVYASASIFSVSILNMNHIAVA